MGDLPQKAITMEMKFVPLLADPISGEPLKLISFKQERTNIVYGLLVHEGSNRVYPIQEGLPILLPQSMDDDFVSKFSGELEYLGVSREENYSHKRGYWSFSSEWEHFFDKGMDKTWGWSDTDRYNQFLMETQTDEVDLKDLVVLDAGCGNGRLTERIAERAKLAIGIDYSDSVRWAEKNRKSSNVCFVKGDLQMLPVARGNFDITVANGVIHHTKSTETTFTSLARSVGTQGKLYVWLYSRKGDGKWRLKRRFFDCARAVVCRFPGALQTTIVKLFSTTLSWFHKYDRMYLEVAMYDSLTPRWRHYHTPEEVALWYHAAGFGPLVLTHFDNSYGFGVVGRKQKESITPGENYGLKVA